MRFTHAAAVLITGPRESLISNLASAQDCSVLLLLRKGTVYSLAERRLERMEMRRKWLGAEHFQVGPRADR